MMAWLERRRINDERTSIDEVWNDMEEDVPKAKAHYVGEKG